MEEVPKFIQQGFPVQFARSRGRKKEWSPFPFRLEWQTGLWFELFEKHIEFIVGDIERAKAAEKLVVYLSCPISSRGGGWSRTNIEVAHHTAQRLTQQWGNRFWILNPTLYQLESREGRGLLKRHAHLLSLEKGLKHEIDIDSLNKLSPPRGGDYLRMWLRILTEDGESNLGGRFDAFYFLGSSDVWNFFTHSGKVNVTYGVEDYFARQFARDPEFRERFGESPHAPTLATDFFRYYTIKASSHFSLGSHDEYNIWRILNELRCEELGLAAQIPGYFDGRQLGLGAAEVPVTRGYEKTKSEKLA